MVKDKRKSIKGKSKLAKSEIKGLSQNNEAIEKYNKNFVVSFQHLDRNQGQTFEEWNKEKLLVNMLDTIRNYCLKPIHEQFSDKFKAYGDFPPSDKTKFKYPKHVPSDVNWASLHLSGKVCLAGYINENVFNIVFLDKNHEFYLSEKKHT